MLRSSDDYIYAVARIRCKENRLFSSKNIEQMLAMNDAESVLRYLTEYGWGTSSTENKDILFVEQQNLWTLMKELVGDLSSFDFFRVQNDYHNLKTSIKAVYSNIDADNMFLYGSVYDADKIYSAIMSKEYDELPEFMRETAREASSVLYKTGDGQLCDAVIDKACLERVYTLGRESGSDIIKRYCELFVASGNIKIAVRGSKLNKSIDFMMKSMTRCDSLDIKKLSSSAAKGYDEVINYLLTTAYKDSVSYLKQSLSAFEKWCDDYIINTLKSQKSEPFTIGPLVAYIVVKLNEIKAVRLILTAKENDLPTEIVRERIREMYV